MHSEKRHWEQMPEVKHILEGELMFERKSVLKKVSTILSVMLVCMLLAGCGTSPEGNWKVTGVKTGGETRTYDDYIRDCGIDDYNVNKTMKLEIYPNGEYKLIMFGDDILGKWVTEEDKYFLNMGGNKLEAVLDGSKLSLEFTDGVIFEFEK